MPANGYKVFYEKDFNPQPDVPPSFTFNSYLGDEVYLTQADAAGNLLGFRAIQKFGAAENPVSFGRYQTSVGEEFVAMSSLTFGVNTPSTVQQFRQGTGQANPYPKIGPAVISELMFLPTNPGTEPVEVPEFEFVEIHNITSSRLPLHLLDYPAVTWRLSNGIDFDFPSQFKLEADERVLIVNFDPQDATALQNFRNRYGLDASVRILGPYSGRLSNEGETVSLEKPDPPQTSGPNQGFIPYILVEKIKFKVVAPWPVMDVGSNKSLQRKIDTEFGNDPVNWLAETPSPGRLNAADTDRDGIPNSWETTYQFNPNSAADAAQDPDQDGMTNFQEYQAGTHPRQAQSLLAFETTAISSGKLQLTFTAQASKSYTVEYATDLFQKNWKTLQDISVQPSVRGVTVQDETPAGRYYRIVTPSK